ncbi:alpha/beta fold hydrolase [Altererythrobacter soli]|uniref:Alpha/beta fold hydrolase n=1 Tax=Croceibacterium soli TaxID=1739690 RepID=A0A6I4UQ02_9SPHN|nr:alpha/beta fold hydrolase [Croceibacterium soli]MXP40931.1 alpha/beta fold hydrolase [Croceibacterium soli]
MSDVRTEHFASFDAADLAIHRMGEGRPVLLLHGLFSDANTNWIRFGHAQRLADAGFEAIMPDLRAHGASGKPHEAAAYPGDVLVRDAQALVAHLGLTDYDLVGFSLGARTAVRCVLAGLSPRRMVLGGMGLEGLAGWDRRASFFIDAIDRFDEVKHGDPAFFAVAFMRTQKIDRVAARLLLQSVDDTSAAELAGMTVPTLVVCGEKDRDNGSPQALADALPDARFQEVPGTHMSSVTEPELGKAIAGFLAG